MQSGKGVGLRPRIFILLAALLSITLGGGGVMIWYTYQIEGLLSSLIETDVASLQAAEALETALINQKGFVSYYFMDGNPKWLVQLEKYRQAFEERLRKAKEMALLSGDRETLDRIEAEYSRYVTSKDQVIRLYDAGRREDGTKLHEHVRDLFFSILALTEQYKTSHDQRILLKREQSHAEADRLRIISASATSASVFLFALLAFVFVSQILGPIRHLALETERARTPGEPADEVATLSKRVRGLIEDRNLTQTELERSRERLLQSEKMALVGKLAAEVAHTIRNPMTSIKMRLFSLERTLQLSPAQKEDLDVISQEMRRLDNIVKNFLEFSRPPKLRMQSCNISDIVDLSLQLLQKRLEFQGVQVERRRGVWLPHAYADPDAIKEVLVNLMINACDAMKDGGQITISEEEGVAEHMGRVVLIRVSDTGPGIPMQLWENVWEPFFSTKDDGTGLGLPIALRIVEEHDGRLELRPSESQGATFIMTLPVHTEEA